MEKILIVDDSVLQATQLKNILQEEYEITVAIRRRRVSTRPATETIP